MVDIVLGELILEKQTNKKKIDYYHKNYFDDYEKIDLNNINNEYYIYVIKYFSEDIGILNIAVNEQEKLSVIRRISLKNEFRTPVFICNSLKICSKLERQNERRKVALNVTIPGNNPELYKRIFKVGNLNAKESISATYYLASTETLKECIAKYSSECIFFEENKRFILLDFPLSKKYIKDIKEYLENNGKIEERDLIPDTKKSEFDLSTSKAVLDMETDKIVCWIQCQKFSESSVIIRKYYTLKEYRDYKLFRAFMIYISEIIIEKNYSVCFAIKEYNKKMARFVNSFFKNKLIVDHYVASEEIEEN